MIQRNSSARLVDTVVEMTAVKQRERKKNNTRNEYSFRGLWDNITHTSICIINVLEGEERGGETSRQLICCNNSYRLPSLRDQSCVFIGRTDAKAATPILWPPHAKSWLIGKDLDAGRDWEQEEKGTTKLTQWT